MGFTKQYGKGILCFLTIIFMALFGCVTAYAEGNADNGDEGNSEDGKTVRVAYVIVDNFQEGEEGERKYGYSYEYLQQIAYYTGWKYEYVYGSYKESLQRLVDGEVDLMAGISYTDERDKLIDYSRYEQGEQSYYVFGLENQTKIDAEDLSTLNNLKIGVNGGGYSAEKAQEWCDNNDIHCELVEYADSQQSVDDLENGIIDGVIASEMYMQSDWIPLIDLGKSSYYFGVTKERGDLLDELNVAMSKIKTDNPFYNENLMAKYAMHTSMKMSRLSSAESEWLEGNPKITIGYISDYMPYCGTDGKTGEAGGMLADLMENIAEIYSMDYEMCSFDSYDDMQEAFAAGEVDAIFPVYGDYNLGENLGFMISDAVTSSTMTVFNGGTEVKETQKMAVTYADPFQSRYAEIYYPEAELVVCDSVDDCTKAVADGDADFTVVETAKVNGSNNVKSRKGIQKANLQENIDICFAVSQGNTNLLSVLNKGILATDDSLITDSLIYHSRMEIKYTAMDFLHEHSVMVLVLIIVAFAVIVAILMGYFRLHIHSHKKILEVEHKARGIRWKAEHDALTGLLNHGAFKELTNRLKNSDKPMALLVADVDSFKEINDTYGHEMGDKALVKVSDLMAQYFRAEDFVMRYAGDEFVIIIINVTRAQGSTIGAKIDRINTVLQNPDDGMPNISLSVGVAFSSQGYQDELFSQADAALYKAKENGRCGYSIYEE